MALGTSLQFGIDVPIIPCGLKYFNGNQFRSKVVVEFGRPYYASKETIEQYKG